MTWAPLSVDDRVPGSTEGTMPRHADGPTTFGMKFGPQGAREAQHRYNTVNYLFRSRFALFIPISSEIIDGRTRS